VSGNKNIVWQTGHVSRQLRESVHGHRGLALWFTGLSGSGKSTLAHEVERMLIERAVSAYVLDGDNIRHGLSSDLGFEPQQRHENMRRIGEVAKLFVDAGLIVLCAFVSPYRADRDRVRASLGEGDFVEVHVRASVETCRSRDPKGLYGKAASGEIADLTGVGSPYEPPEHPELVLDTEHQAIAESVAGVIEYLEQRAAIPKVAS
jgi:adenylylsulfate kinase